MIKRFMLMLVALMFAFCTSAMAAKKDVVTPSAEPQKVEEQQDSEKQECEGDRSGGETTEPS